MTLFDDMVGLLKTFSACKDGEGAVGSIAKLDGDADFSCMHFA